MELIDTTDIQMLDQVKELYEKSFPKSEKKPFEMIEQMRATGHADIFSLMDPDFSGLLITMKNDEMLLIDYFAVSPAMQGNGKGSKALEVFGKLFPGKPVFLEIESPDGADEQDVRKRRQRFYEDNGFSMMDYTISLFDVPMKIMVRGGIISFEQYRGFLVDRLGEWSAKHILLLEE